MQYAEHIILRTAQGPNAQLKYGYAISDTGDLVIDCEVSVLMRG